MRGVVAQNYANIIVPALLVNQIREETGVWTPPPEFMIYPLGGPSSRKRCGTHGWAHYLLQVERGLFLQKGKFSPPSYEHFRLVSKACWKIPIWLRILRIYFAFWRLWNIQNCKYIFLIEFRNFGIVQPKILLLALQKIIVTTLILVSHSRCC